MQSPTTVDLGSPRGPHTTTPTTRQRNPGRWRPRGRRFADPAGLRAGILLALAAATLLISWDLTGAASGHDASRMQVANAAPAQTAAPADTAEPHGAAKR